MKQFIRYSLLSLVLPFLGCGSSNSGDGMTGEGDGTAGNPIMSQQIFGQAGNLYKPSADPISSGAGNLVVLLSQAFTERFATCEIPLKSGETGQLICIDFEPWTQTPFSCFSNNNRQTWRANFKCDAVAEVRVTCRDAQQEVEFTVPEAVRGQVCSRFG